MITHFRRKMLSKKSSMQTTSSSIRIYKWFNPKEYQTLMSKEMFSLYFERHFLVEYKRSLRSIKVERSLCRLKLKLGPCGVKTETGCMCKWWHQTTHVALSRSDRICNIQFEVFPWITLLFFTLLLPTWPLFYFKANKASSCSIPESLNIK